MIFHTHMLKSFRLASAWSLLQGIEAIFTKCLKSAIHPEHSLANFSSLENGNVAFMWQPHAKQKFPQFATYPEWFKGSAIKHSGVVLSGGSNASCGFACTSA